VYRCAEEPGEVFVKLTQQQLQSSVGIPVAYYFMVSTAPPGREVEMEVLARAKSDLVDRYKAIFSCARREKARQRTLRALEEKDLTKHSLKLLGIEV
jgi:hypothetical protein